MSLGQGEGRTATLKKRALGWLQLCKLPEAGSQAGKPATLTRVFLLEEKRGHSGFSGVWLERREGPIGLLPSHLEGRAESTGHWPRLPWGTRGPRLTSSSFSPRGRLRGGGASWGRSG